MTLSTAEVAQAYADALGSSDMEAAGHLLAVVFFSSTTMSSYSAKFLVSA